MKKLLLIFLVLPLFFSCSSDDDLESLDGTIWEAYDDEYGVIYVSTMTFSGSTFST